MVKAGELLVQIDPRPYQAALDQAAGQLKRDRGIARQCQGRSGALQDAAGAEFGVRSDLRHAGGDGGAGRGHRRERPGGTRSRAAQSRLLPHHLAGEPAWSGLRQVDIGNLMQANATAIVVVTQLQPMSVLFTVPEDSLSNILQRLRSGPEAGGRCLRPQRHQQDRQRHAGQRRQPDRHHDRHAQAAGDVRQHDNSSCFPISSSTCACCSIPCTASIVVPGAAMQQGASGSYVYVVNADSTVSLRAVTPGPTSGDLVSITKGLQAGERVVVDGADQLRDGAHVVVPGTTASTGAGSSGGAPSTHRHGAASAAMAAAAPAAVAVTAPAAAAPAAAVPAALNTGASRAAATGRRRPDRTR